MSDIPKEIRSGTKREFMGDFLELLRMHGVVIREGLDLPYPQLYFVQDKHQWSQNINDLVEADPDDDPSLD